jgi:hypothetical protein
VRKGQSCCDVKQLGEFLIRQCSIFILHFFPIGAIDDLLRKRRRLLTTSSSHALARIRAQRRLSVFSTFCQPMPIAGATAPRPPPPPSPWPNPWPNPTTSSVSPGRCSSPAKFGHCFGPPINSSERLSGRFVENFSIIPLFCPAKWGILVLRPFCSLPTCRLPRLGEASRISGTLPPGSLWGR